MVGIDYSKSLRNDADFDETVHLVPDFQPMTRTFDDEKLIVKSYDHDLVVKARQEKEDELDPIDIAEGVALDVPFAEDDISVDEVEAVEERLIATGDDVAREDVEDRLSYEDELEDDTFEELDKVEDIVGQTTNAKALERIDLSKYKRSTKDISSQSRMKTLQQRIAEIEQEQQQKEAQLRQQEIQHDQEPELD